VKPQGLFHPQVGVREQMFGITLCLFPQNSGFVAGEVQELIELPLGLLKHL
jgi:hypothetical protein